MGFYTLFRLLWRPGFILLAIALVMNLEIHLLSFPQGRFRNIPEPERLNLFVFLLPAFIGAFTGRALSELQHTLFSWTLPNLRQKLFSAVLFTSSITALLITCIYYWLDGPAPLLPIFTSTLLWYSMGTAYTTGEILKSSSRKVRLAGVPVLTLLVLILAGFQMHRISEFYLNQPFLSIALTLLGTSLYMYQIFNATSARAKSLVLLNRSLTQFGISYQEEGVTTQKKSSGQTWQHTGPLTSFFDWIRAGAYENFGSKRGGWLVDIVKLSGVTLVIIILLYLVGYKNGAHESGIQYIYRAIFDSTHLTNNNPMTIAFNFFAIAGCVIMLGYSLFLQRGWLYPLSRARLAKLAYGGSLLHSTFFCGTIVITLLTAGGLIALYAGYDIQFNSIPGFIRPLCVLFIFIPVAQWLRLRYGLTSMRMFLIAFVLFILVVWSFGIFWLEMAPGLLGIYEAPLAACLILLSQSLFFYKLKSYFKTADLI